MNRELRERLFTRTCGYCERCGGVMAYEDMAVHHRLLRSQGGTDSISNLMGLHHACHNLANWAVHAMPHRSYNEGWMVRAGHDPRTTSMRVPDGMRVLLRDDGLYDYPCMECERVWPMAFQAKDCARRDKTRDDDRIPEETAHE